MATTTITAIATTAMDDFVIRALAGGVGVAAVAGPLGCFMVWRRMAYFGETLANSALLGVALGVLLGIAPTPAIVAVCLAVAVALFALQRQRRLPTDTLLGVLAHASLAAGLIVTAFLETVRADLMSYLFGDILAITRLDILWIYGGGAVALVLLFALWRPLITLTLHEDLAQVEGVPVHLLRFVLMLLFALVVAVAMKVVGIVLLVSLLIIPAAAARRLSASPAGMAVAAGAIGCAAVAGGLGASLQWDIPTGAAIVAAAAVIFFVAIGLPSRRAA